jgi:hypothetical protein
VAEKRTAWDDAMLWHEGHDSTNFLAAATARGRADDASRRLKAIPADAPEIIAELVAALEDSNKRFTGLLQDDRVLDCETVLSAYQRGAIGKQRAANTSTLERAKEAKP